jgi:hypothetical protein
MSGCLRVMHLDAMRTTVTLDDQLLRQLKARAASSGKPFRQVVNEVLRAGLASQAPADRPPYRCPSFSIGGLAAGVDLDKALLLAGELEDEALAEKLRQGR